MDDVGFLGRGFERSVVEFSGTSAEVLVPEGEGSFPAVVTVHGGGFVGGSPEFMRPLAELLAGEGYLVVNTAYALSTPDLPAYPHAVNDVACAIRIAGTHPASDGTVAVIGASAGAHMAALVALTGDRYGDDCPTPPGAVPGRLVCLGYIDITLRYSVPPPGERHPLFQLDPADVSDELWYAANPIYHANGHPDLEALFIHAENDEMTSLAAAEELISALADQGTGSDITIIPGIGHFVLADTEHTGTAIVEWLNRPSTT